MNKIANVPFCNTFYVMEYYIFVDVAMCHLKDKYTAILDSLPVSLCSLQQSLTDEQIANILSDDDARAINQKILNCLIERVICEEDILDLCTSLAKIEKAPPRLISVIEQLRRGVFFSTNGTLAVPFVM